MSSFQAKHIRRAHAITIDAPVAQTFPLFTPAGERLWVEGWDPVHLYPHDDATRLGMVFTTGAGADLTCWSLVDYDPARYRARYARVTPASRFGFVEVTCEAAGPHATRATVAYTYTGLNEAGNEFIDAFTEDSYREMIEEWRGLIGAYLARAARG